MTNRINLLAGAIVCGMAIVISPANIRIAKFQPILVPNIILSAKIAATVYCLL